MTDFNGNNKRPPAFIHPETLRGISERHRAERQQRWRQPAEISGLSPMVDRGLERGNEDGSETPVQRKRIVPPRQSPIAKDVVDSLNDNASHAERPVGDDSPIATQAPMTQARSKTRVAKKKPHDPEKERLLEGIRQYAQSMKRPRRDSFTLDPTMFHGISLKNQDFLSGRPRDDRPWSQHLWLAARDLHGNGYSLLEVLAMLFEASEAWDDAERRDLAIRTIANAYSKPRESAREYEQRCANAIGTPHSSAPEETVPPK